MEDYNINNERRVMVSTFSTECVPQVRFLIIISEVCTFHASESAAYGLLSSPCYTVYYTSGAGIEPMTLRTEDQHFDHSAKLNCLKVNGGVDLLGSREASLWRELRIS